MKKYSSGFEWSYRDLLFTMMVAYMAMAAMALIVTSKIAKVESVSPGNILIELFWDKNKNADVDLWVKAPGEKPVGYSNKSSVVFNLLRDDLGISSDPESRNQELVVGRGLHQGEYIVGYGEATGHTHTYVSCARPRTYRCNRKDIDRSIIHSRTKSRAIDHRARKSHIHSQR